MLLISTWAMYCFYVGQSTMGHEDFGDILDWIFVMPVLKTGNHYSSI